jgi:hypothetical protein
MAAVQSIANTSSETWLDSEIQGQTRYLERAWKLVAFEKFRDVSCTE